MTWHLILCQPLVAPHASLLPSLIRSSPAGEMVNLVSHDALTVFRIVPMVSFLCFAPFEISSTFLLCPLEGCLSCPFVLVVHVSSSLFYHVPSSWPSPILSITITITVSRSPSPDPRHRVEGYAGGVWRDDAVVPGERRDHAPDGRHDAAQDGPDRRPHARHERLFTRHPRRQDVRVGGLLPQENRASSK